jgi:hypothetical protein
MNVVGAGLVQEAVHCYVSNARTSGSFLILIEA